MSEPTKIGISAEPDRLNQLASRMQPGLKVYRGTLADADDPALRAHPDEWFVQGEGGAIVIHSPSIDETEVFLVSRR